MGRNLLISVESRVRKKKKLPPAQKLSVYVLNHHTAMDSTDLRNEMTCCICLNLYTDPVTLICGHNFCRECIDNVLDSQVMLVGYSCPQCRARFRERPTLQRNTTLGNIADHFHSQEERQTLCVYCIQTPMVASKSCLTCEVSLCDVHLAVHSKQPDHVLIEPTISYRSRKCCHHSKNLLFYCAEDAQCLCVSCLPAENERGHEISLINDAYRKKKEKLKFIQARVLQEREKIEKQVQRLQDHLKSTTEKAAGIVEKVSVQFQDIRMKQDIAKSRILDEIPKQQEQVSLQVSNLIQQLDNKRDSLSCKLTAIEKLCHMTDPLLYLQADKGDLMLHSDESLKELEVPYLSEDLLISTLNSDLANIMFNLHKGYYVQEASGLLLDVSTAANDVHISDDLTTASWSNVHQHRPKTPKRFAIRRVLSTTGFSTGRLYWDVEVSKEGGWRVGMAYPSISRSGKSSLIGNNKKSWGLRSFNKQYSVKHNAKEIPLACRPSCYKVRIYLDYAAGLLSFYELGDSMRHLYTYNTTFTEALYPVIVVWANAWVRVLK
ncbi:nuclear factor 7, brain-like isoform X2 [Ranitomeya variabilis]|uniref:nuclear factor 7, brain-like isoform X2 n=1 Tax=Ranitomeya variabilis TaxID=490064 RepID=UPI004057C625